MQSLLSLTLLLAGLAFAQAQSYSTISQDPNAPCLSHPEAANIALRWLTIFQTDSSGNGTGAALVNNTLQEAFSYTDEGASFGNPTPLYQSRGDVYNSVSSSGYSGALVTDVQYDLLYTFQGCDIIGLRWRSNSLAAKNENVTAPVGTKITYLGTDYLQVNLTNRLIYNATSSSDLINYYTQLKDDVIKAME